MKFYPIKLNQELSPVSLLDDTLESMFRPLFYDEKFDAMKTDIVETETDYKLEIELPGFNKEEISVDFENKYLSVRAEKKETEEDKKRNFVRKERSISCQRSYYVGDINEEEITAKYENGVLILSIPKTEREKPQRKGITID